MYCVALHLASCHNAGMRNEKPRPEEICHPGSYVRNEVIPHGTSVKKAAELLGLGRPALSNFLNGKARLSQQMALRLQKTFGVDSGQLLAMQSAFDQQNARPVARSIAVKKHVPNYLKIAALQLQGWADGIDARSLLPVLLRRLAHTAASGLSEVDFPGYDNSQRPGWDGWIVAEEVSPWVPAGKSGWEFGCNKNPKNKADEDYGARTNGDSLSPDERSQITFIFVTPRMWPGKTKWVKTKNAEGLWKEVRAYDASDLEQWIEQSIPASAWLAEQLGISTQGIMSLDECWARWSLATEPQLSRKLFDPATEQYSEQIKGWLDKSPENPRVIAADSERESLAFLSCLLNEDAELADKADKVVVVESGEVLRKLAASNADLIFVVPNNEAAWEIGDLCSKFHVFLLRPKNVPSEDADIRLDILPYDRFRSALEDMGFDHEQIEMWYRKSGSSSTILRRLLAKNSVLKWPEWTSERDIAKGLIPIVLAGAWDSNSPSDQCVLELLSDGKDYEAIERDVVDARKLDDSPVWMIANMRGVVSKLDALYAISDSITEADLTRFFQIARIVLDERDPALDLPEDKRYMASIYGKVREHSRVLREAFCETVVLLSVHGRNRFSERFSLDVELEVNKLIKELLLPINSDRLGSQERDLPYYAEAAPSVFLDIVEDDLRSHEPQVLSLMVPASNAIFSSCSRTGLLWALELLAWNPTTLPRVIDLLGRLSREPINDNWVNKPEASLESIFRSWMPQTAAPLEQRKEALNLLIRKHPDVAWRVCSAQFEFLSRRVGDYSYRPHWRSDSNGAGHPVEHEEDNEFVIYSLERCLAWPFHSVNMLRDLLESLRSLADEFHARVWDLVDEWIEKQGDERALSELREAILRICSTRRARIAGVSELTERRAKKALERLLPESLVLRYKSLFIRHWVEETADEFDDEDLDYSERDKRIALARENALREIWNKHGFDGVVKLANESEDSSVIGVPLSKIISGAQADTKTIRQLLKLDSPHCGDRLLAGFLSGRNESSRKRIIDSLIPDLQSEDCIRMLLALPFAPPTWRIASDFAEDVSASYWEKVRPYWGSFSAEELREVVDQLVLVGRPFAALEVAHLDWGSLDTARLKNLVMKLAASNEDDAGIGQMRSYHITSALKELASRVDVTTQELARLEFIYFEAFEEHGAVNLDNQLTENPELFVELIVYVIRRGDGGKDPDRLIINDPDLARKMGTKCYRILQKMRRCPGLLSDGSVDGNRLRVWVEGVQRCARELGRAEWGDYYVGELLSGAPEGQDGIWPCQSVRNVVEEVWSERLGEGLHIGIRNSRGAVWRGDGGNQERALAAKYRGWAERVAYSSPNMSGVLRSVADSYDHDAGWEDDRERIRRRTSR